VRERTTGPPLLPEYAVGVKLAVGDVVVYGNHGVGRIAAREERAALGTTREVVVVEFGDDLTVTLPLELAATQLRPVASEEDLRRVSEALRDDSELSVDPWLSRRKHALDKLTRGGPVELAEMVSEGARRERLRTARGSKPQLSSSEVEVFTRARTLLSTEIALALGIQPAAADGWIDEQLERPA
jgi:CarD family transcriptional regulator, regulator of rRNA transcription